MQRNPLTLLSRCVTSREWGSCRAHKSGVRTSTSQQACTLPSDQADPWDPRSTRASLLRSGPSSRAGTSAFAGGPRSPAGATASLPALLYGADAPDAKPDPGPGPGSYELNHFDTIQAGLGKGFGRMSAPFHIPESVDRFGR